MGGKKQLTSGRTMPKAWKKYVCPKYHVCNQACNKVNNYGAKLGFQYFLISICM